MKKYFEIRGKQLYTEILGKEQNQPVLFIHGGPGGIGCVDFVKYQGTNLSKKLKIIALDQRGVWRSEAISDNEKLSFEDIIDDFEALRRQLKIEKWSIISHSFGGYLTVLYAIMYPGAINCIVYENPSFDFSLSERSMLNSSIKELDKIGKTSLAQIYREKLVNTVDYKDVNYLLMQVGKELGNHCNKIMWYGEDNQIIEQLAMNTQGGREFWNKSMNTRINLLKDGRAYKDVFSELATIEKSSLLIKGAYDSITDDKQLENFNGVNAKRKIVVFEKSGHYARIEEPQKYAETVIEFILGNAR